MTQRAAGQKRPVNMTLSVALVGRARALTKNLSETVEGLLLAYVAAEEARLRRGDAPLTQWSEVSNAAAARQGSPGDEHNPF